MYFLIPSGINNEHIINIKGRAGRFYPSGQLVWIVHLNSIIFTNIFSTIILNYSKRIVASVCVSKMLFCEAVGNLSRVEGGGAHYHM